MGVWLDGVVACFLSVVKESFDNVFVYSAGHEGCGFGGDLAVYGLFEGVLLGGGACSQDS